MYEIQNFENINAELAFFSTQYTYPWQWYHQIGGSTVSFILSEELHVPLTWFHFNSRRGEYGDCFCHYQFYLFNSPFRFPIYFQVQSAF